MQLLLRVGGGGVLARTQKLESETPLVKSGRSVTHKIASRMRCRENTLYFNNKHLY
jgi:hypothetical protein